MQDQGIVRNRMKIEGAIASAQAWLEIMASGAGFCALSMGVRRRQADRQPPPADRRGSRRDRAVAHDLKGPQGARLQILRADDYLCVHAGNRHGQRPLDQLSPTRSMREAWTGVPLAAAARIHAARIGTLFLDLAVALSDADRAHALHGSLQDAALGGRRLGAEGLTVRRSLRV